MNKTVLLSYIFLIFSSIFFTLGVNAEMYKWIDEDGNTQYSQSPPIGNTAVEIIKPPSRVDTESAAKALDERKETADKLREDRIKSTEENQTAEEEALAKQQKCDQARKRLASYQRPRVSLTNSDGSKRVLSDEERQAEIAKSNESIKTYCE